MWIGLSKNLGNGYKIGVGTRVGARARPTQRDLANFEKTEFLRKVATEVGDLLNNLLINNNIDPPIAKKYHIPTDQLLAANKQAEKSVAILSKVNEINEILQKVAYGGNLTEKRRDSMIDLILELHRLIDPAEKSLLDTAADTTTQKMHRWQRNTLIVIFCFLSLPALIVAIALFIDSKEIQWTMIAMFFLTSIAMTGILSLITNPIFRLIGKISYNREAKKIMRNEYGTLIQNL